jgi:hypothetical protein
LLVERTWQYGEVTEKTSGCAFEFVNGLEPLFLESLYEKASSIAPANDLKNQQAIMPGWLKGLGSGDN